MTQLPLTFAPSNRTRTSRAGARHVAPKAPTQAARILDFVRYSRAYGVTRQELATFLEMPLASVCGRVSGLLDGGKVYVDGTREGAAGVMQEILKVRESA